MGCTGKFDIDFSGELASFYVAGGTIAYYTCAVDTSGSVGIDCDGAGNGAVQNLAFGIRRDESETKLVRNLIIPNNAAVIVDIKILDYTGFFETADECVGDTEVL